MKAKIIHKDSGIHKKHYSLVDKFIKDLQKEFPLKEDIEIVFMGKRGKEMSTGGRLDHKLKILTKKRLIRDIFRTLAHEWVHEYERDVLHYPEGKDIGGKNENMANAEAGKMVKKFEKHFPKKEKEMYTEF